VGDNDGNFNISFGINSSGVVIAWLGDLDGLPSHERLHWIHENISPRGDNKSEFFDAQIAFTAESAFTPPPLPIRCLNELAKWNAAFARKHGVYLYKPRSIEDRIQDTRRYKRLLFNNSDDFKRFLSELNEIVNENTNNQKLRAFLKVQDVHVKSGTKGIKLLEKVYREVLGDSENLIAPFFYLYDLRLWADHTGLVDRLTHVVEQLGVADPDDYNTIMDRLLQSIMHSSKKLGAKVEQAA
jgi:hypothetical protein